MKIITIFADRLFAFQYDDEEENELDRLLNLWHDTEYLYDFMKQNKADLPANKSVNKIV